MKKYASFRIGGRAEYFLEAGNREDIIAGLRWAGERGIPWTVLGAASNVLLPGRVPGLVIRNAVSGIERGEGGRVVVASGTPMAALVDFCVAEGLQGFEWAGGIPGTVGGAVYGNAGAFGGEMKDSLVSVESLAVRGDVVRTVRRTRAGCRFGYRDSVFKHRPEIILSCAFALRKADKRALRKTVDEHIRYRREHLPLEYPSAGSFFKNIPVRDAPAALAKEFKAVLKNDPFPLIPVAAVIAALGLMGKRIGGAQVSEIHPNFIINRRAAKRSDVAALSELVVQTVFEKYGVKLEREVQML